jgi:A/G-specific adenine glycosylase
MKKGDFAAKLVQWQRLEGRHKLPWQNTQDPYRIWVSEIMLQQTQVATVTGYYEVFMARFPDVQSLAQASLDEVMALWSGLGYYRRARHLHACAQAIVARYRGEFPRDEKRLQELPGIGRSTAAAIAAFAFRRRAAILDGNVKRVLARVFALELDTQSSQSLKVFWSLAESLLPRQEDMPAYTQGLMDLGATRCLPRQPACESCPLQSLCKARSQGRPQAFPLAKPAKPLPLRYWLMLWISDGQRILLFRRPDQGIWASLWSLPALEVLPESVVAAWDANQRTVGSGKTKTCPGSQRTFREAVKVPSDEAIEEQHSMAQTMHELWRQACMGLVDHHHLPDAIKNVINLSVSPDAKLDGLAQLEQSFTHFRLRAPLLHIRLKIGATATKPWVASEAEPGFRLEAGFVEHAQALWIRPEDALKLGIARCLRKLFEAHRR